MRILFMGTPDFAVSSLKALYESGEHAITVVTQPDKPKGRGYTLTPPEVKVYAESVGLAVYQPNTLRDEAFAALLAELDHLAGTLYTDKVVRMLTDEDFED